MQYFIEQNLLYQTCETKLFPRKLQCFAKDWGMFATEIEESFFCLVGAPLTLEWFKTNS